MRRIVVLAALLAALATPAAAGPLDFNIFAAVDTSGKLDLGDISLDSDTGFAAGLELVFDLPVLDVGVGAEYGIPRGFSGSTGDFSYTFLYAVARFNFAGPVYAVGRYGYTDPKVEDLDSPELSGSGAWSAGFGVSLLGKLMLEVLYNSVGGDTDYDATMARVILSF